jgi:PAS domain S-box-containing protein
VVRESNVSEPRRWSGNIQRYVTERKRADAKPRRSKAYLAEGQKLSRTGSRAWNVASGELFWSDQQFRIFGLDPEWETPSLPMALHFIHPDDRSFVLQALDKAVREKTDHEWDCRIVTTDGTIKTVHTTAHPVFESGTLTEYVGTTMDITERTQADVHLRQLSGRLLQLQDDEMRWFARELHDSTGQTLTGMSLRLAVVEDEIASLSGRARQALAESASLLDQASRELRSLSYLLHLPFLDDSGLRSAVPWYVDGFSHRSGIQVQVDSAIGHGRLPGDDVVSHYSGVPDEYPEAFRQSDGEPSDPPQRE